MNGVQTKKACADGLRLQKGATAHHGPRKEEIGGFTSKVQKSEGVTTQHTRGGCRRGGAKIIESGAPIHLHVLG